MMLSDSGLFLGHPVFLLLI